MLVYHRNRVRDNADVARMKGKRANKVATKRLKKALQLLNAGRQNLFYDETLRALWGYAGDKLNMPVVHQAQLFAVLRHEVGFAA